MNLFARSVTVESWYWVVGSIPLLGTDVIAGNNLSRHQIGKGSFSRDNILVPIVP